MEILRTENLSFSYPNSDKKAVDNLSLSVTGGSFVVVCGESGCGKTTLLKLLKKELAPFGQRNGEIFYKDTPQDEVTEHEGISQIGFVLQNPDSQIVTDKVWHELAFGLENLGMEPQAIRRRVSEMASYFGIQGWFHKNTDELSGGQKQLLNLAAVMVMQPEILILDEPTSQLDPIAASDFIATLQKLNRELGLTIILSEHRLEEVLPVADKVLVMQNGGVLYFDSPRAVAERLAADKNRLLYGMPGSVRIFSGLDVAASCPLTVREGRAFVREHFANDIREYDAPEYVPSTEAAVKLENVWFSYGRGEPDVLRGAELTVYKGELFCILGGNGTGKTTALGVMSGLLKSYKGKTLLFGKKIKSYPAIELYRGMITYLPQDPKTVFVRESVREDLNEMTEVDGEANADAQRVEAVAERLGISGLLDRHPYDLSGGEQQKCALAKLLLLNPKIVLLDEPTKGLDAYSKRELKKILEELQKSGVTVITVTHDVEFAAETAGRCALMFDGEFVSVDTPERFFSDNNFYTTSANRIARGWYHGAVTCAEVTEMCRRNGAVNG